VLDPHLPHPFAAGHGMFGLCYALAISGQWGAALAAVGDFDRLLDQGPAQRFRPMAANLRGWLLRGAGQLDAAKQLHRAALDLAVVHGVREAHYAALLDLAEDGLAGDDLDAATEAMHECEGILLWTGSMFWRHRNRYRLLADRLRSAGGDHQGAADDARAVAQAAAARGDRRYRWRAELVAATADARAGHAPPVESVGSIVEWFAPQAGPDGWRDLGELALALRSDEVWHQAEKAAAQLVAEASGRAGIDPGSVATAVRTQLERLRP